jgi:hypothetical protein
LLLQVARVLTLGGDAAFSATGVATIQRDSCRARPAA